MEGWVAIFRMTFGSFRSEARQVLGLKSSPLRTDLQRELIMQLRGTRPIRPFGFMVDMTVMALCFEKITL